MSETLTIILSVVGVNIALFGAIGTLIIWAINKVDNDVKSINGRMESFERRMDGHAQRIDQLYKMFVDLLAKK